MTAGDSKEAYGKHERANACSLQGEQGGAAEGGTAVGSFVIRCQAHHDEALCDAWRIRVTYVQGQEEMTVASWEEAVLFMQQRMKRGME
ncbi:hypothetical protein LQV63_19640 [Paenibacillus profundus]|uniref:Uncharacterized protein n=1 Tax=Paenibacillus profundus TaxID=1173085 RepID=A0ABS8YM34_9BACL|nr:MULTISPECIES: hypothetical protein [Paenibacillus]MCE5171518.1 hypothetical protein [Paenibacillus profundus]